MEINTQQLLSFIERAERLEEEMSNLRQDLKEVFAEASASGFDVKTIKAVIKARKIDPEERAMQEELVQIYLDNID